MAAIAGASRIQAPTSTPGAGSGLAEAKATEVPSTKVVVMTERVEGFMLASVERVVCDKRYDNLLSLVSNEQAITDPIYTIYTTRTTRYDLLYGRCLSQLQSTVIWLGQHSRTASVVRWLPELSSLYFHSGD